MSAAAAAPPRRRAVVPLAAAVALVALALLLCPVGGTPPLRVPTGACGRASCTMDLRHNSTAGGGQAAQEALAPHSPRPDSGGRRARLRPTGTALTVRAALAGPGNNWAMAPQCFWTADARCVANRGAERDGGCTWRRRRGCARASQTAAPQPQLGTARAEHPHLRASPLPPARPRSDLRVPRGPCRRHRRHGPRLAAAPGGGAHVPRPGGVQRRVHGRGPDQRQIFLRLAG
jgi:hypothetical protein